MQGAFYGGILAIVFVVVLGITAQIKYSDEPFLHSSILECDCIVNTTINELPTEPIIPIDEGNGFWRMIYKISYIYYSMIGTGLTVFFGLLVSTISDMFTRNQILKITSSHDISHPHHFYPHRHFSVASFTAATGRKLSTLIHHVAHDVSQSTLKVESILKEVISHTNLHHLHHGLAGDSDERIGILSEEEGECDTASIVQETRSGKMFFIGEDEEYDEMLSSDHQKPHLI